MMNYAERKMTVLLDRGRSISHVFEDAKFVADLFRDSDFRVSSGCVSDYDAAYVIGRAIKDTLPEIESPVERCLVFLKLVDQHPLPADWPFTQFTQTASVAADGPAFASAFVCRPRSN